jgi:hypothetical protein
MEKKEKEEENMARVIVTRFMVGICHMQVCAIADVTDEEILEVCNRENPSGTTAGWGKVIREGDGKHRQCSDYPDRMHFLVEC